MNASDSFFDSGRQPTREPSRPRAVNPQTGREQSWQTASNYASPLDNPHGLITWKLRELVKGLSLRTDLARMLLTGAAIEDNGKADEIIAAAHATAEIDAKANEGTAVHAALSRAFLGHEVPIEYAQHVAAFAAELQRNGLTPVATEVKTLCVALGVIGHTDWIVRTSDGRHLILDVKTGKLGEAKRKFSVQCKAYAGSEYIDDGKGGWLPIPFALDQTEAVLAHVDPVTGATALYRVDLVLGFYGATLAERVRGWHKIEVLSPYTPVHPSIPQTNPDPVKLSGPVAQQLPAPQEQTNAQRLGGLTVAEATGQQPDFECRFDGRLASAHPIDVPGQFHCLTPQPREVEASAPRVLTPMEMIVGATSLQTIGIAEAAAARTPDGWTPQLQAAASAKAIELAARTTAPAVPVSVASQPGVSTLDELMATKNTKPILQKMAKNLGCLDLAHDRKWLALWIIATEDGADPAQAAAYAKSKGTAPIGAASLPVPPGNASAAVLAPSAAESTPFALKHIAEAASAEDIDRFRANIVERSGDLAWTDEMAAAATARVAELPDGDITAAVLARIAEAVEPRYIADLWEQLTLGGSLPDAWTPRIRAAADARLATIAATQPAPPVNPYGPQQ